MGSAVLKRQHVLLHKIYLHVGDALAGVHSLGAPEYWGSSLGRKLQLGFTDVLQVPGNHMTDSCHMAVR